jgi:hypothetical protein
MAEFRLGRLKFNWTGVWQPNYAYVLDDIISFKGNTYVCVVNHTSITAEELWEETDLNSTPAKWELYTPGVRNAGEWNPSTFYAVNDIVRYGGNVYICKANHTSAENENLFYESNFSVYWELFLNGNENKGEWLPLTWYKINDLVKYGNNIYLCVDAHTSESVFDLTKFSVYLESVKFEDNWDEDTEYQPGDIVLFGGYAYASKTINVGKQPNTYVSIDWEVITVGFQSKGAYDPEITYVPGDVVTFGGNSFVKLLTSESGISPDEEGEGSIKWGLISEGLSYKGEWNDQTTYQKHDVVTSGTSTYINLIYNNFNNDPAVAGSNSIWSLLAAGSEQSTITQKGDLLYRATATNARLPIGDPGQILYASELGVPIWGNNKARKVYFVTLDGVDDFDSGYGQSIGRAFRTVRYAVDIAAQEGCDELNPASVYVKAGVYNEICPIIVPPYCAIIGDDSRGTIIQPDDGTQQRPDGGPAIENSDMQIITIPSTLNLLPGDTVVFGSGKTAELMHFTDAEGSPAGAELKRRFYIKNLTGGYIINGDTVRNGNNISDPFVTVQNATILENTRATLFFLSEGVMLKDLIFNNTSANAGYVEPPTFGIDPDENAEAEALYDEYYGDITKSNIGFAFFRIAPTLVPQITIKSPYIYSCAAYSKRGVGAIVDGSINADKQHPSHPVAGHQSMLFGNLTQFHENGVGIWVKDNGNSEVVSSFSYYAHIGYASTGGGRMRSLAGNTSWGEYGCAARGFDVNEIPLEGTVRGTELIFLTSEIDGNFGLGSIISNQSALNDIAINGIVGDGTTAIISFNVQETVPYELGKKITVSEVSETAFNGTFVVTGVTTSSVSFASSTIAAVGSGGVVRPALAKAELLYKVEFGLFTKFLIEPITGYIGNNTVVTQITGTSGSTSAPPSPAPIGKTVIPDGIEVLSANRQVRGSKFAVLNLTEKPKITSAVTFAGDARNYVIQEIERYSASPSDFLKIADVTRTSSVTGQIIPIARTGTFESPVIIPAEEHLGGTEVTLYSLLDANLNDDLDSNFTQIDNPGATLTSADATNINVLDANKVAAAKALYDVPGVTELFLLVENEIMKPVSTTSTQFDSFVTVIRGQEGTIAQEHADKDGDFPNNSIIRFIVKHNPVTTLRQDLTNLSNTLVFNPETNNGGITFFDFTSSPSSPNPLLTINVNDFIKIDNEFFRVDNKTTRNPGSAILTFFPSKPISEPSGKEFFIRYRFSQIRLTGHDMLEIGTGGIATTNFPNEPLVRPRETRETNFVAPARIYYVTTNQDGNFKVGEFFRIDQATGKTNIDASQISLVGIGGIQFGDGGNLIGARVEKFDPDETLGQENASDIIVPTQRAVKTYVDNNFLNKNDDAQIGSLSQNANFSVFGNVDIKNDLVVEGNVTINGSTTTVNSATLDIEDKNIVLGNVAGGAASNSTADGGGLTLRGDTDKTINWSQTTNAWTFSENIDIQSDKAYHIDSREILSSDALFNNALFTNIDMAPFGTSLSIGSAIGNTTVNNTLNLSPGTNSKAPLSFGSSTALLNTPQQGAIEYNNTVIYATPSNTGVSGRAHVETSYLRRLIANKATLRNGNATIENIFAGNGAATGGAFRMSPSTLYKFESLIIAQNSSAAAASLFNIGFNNFVATGTWTNGSNVISFAAPTSGSITVGATVTGTGIPANTRITAIISGTEGTTGQYEISNNTTSAGTNVTVTGSPNTVLINNIQYTSFSGLQASTVLTFYNTASTMIQNTQNIASTALRNIKINGFLFTTNGGLLVPQINKSLTTGAFTLYNGSYFSLQPIASSTITTPSGNWT